MFFFQGQCHSQPNPAICESCRINTSPILHTPFDCNQDPRKKQIRVIVPTRIAPPPPIKEASCPNLPQIRIHDPLVFSVISEQTEQASTFPTDIPAAETAPSQKLNSECGIEKKQPTVTAPVTIDSSSTAEQEPPQKTQSTSVLPNVSPFPTPPPVPPKPTHLMARMDSQCSGQQAKTSSKAENPVSSAKPDEVFQQMPVSGSFSI
ncbi:Vegetative cell wall protein gp1-like [Caenorhabditis elegans]|uniref:Vegetative cell wall protein gp1-like n=1 Tax=Caenorhabditis elegans TaxID=6239 RepID=Q17984_CAEEL|nr:Vegetative cell wall protein gp1-like [Caenorhabditis elegans]CCD64517.1 Vegetative cell wall protein gp1-like [Caenorhabditis elegans]|eukprot:NP_508332.1 Uncharacterized protein CELE_C14E2.3 [Caenorhabditis elegans]